MAALDLQTARELLDLTEEELLVRLGASLGDLERNVRYEGLESVGVLFRPDAFQGRIYLRDGRPQMVYVSDPEGWTGPRLVAELGGPGTILRSRAGKMFNHHVHPEKGVAWSADGDEVAFVEVFRPCTLAEYERDIYRDPGPFIR